MSGPFGSSQWMYASGGFYPYEIEQSLRFNDGDSARLARTPASATNQKTFTLSVWVKRGDMGNTDYILSSGITTGFSTWFGIINQRISFASIDPTGSFYYHNSASSAFFRDPSAWYHIVLSVDTTQATSTDRINVYVNGVEQALVGGNSVGIGSGSGSNTIYPTQNLDLAWNRAALHYIARLQSSYYDGYLSEFHFIDGSQIDATNFGEFKSGIWIPKEYTGSYGTNGFYLSFADSSAIGDDLSGNTNDWTPSGLAATDVLLDSPTENYCVLNAVDNYNTGATLSEGNLKWVIGAADGATRSTFVMTSGKWYAEFLPSDYCGVVGIEDAVTDDVNGTPSVWYLSNGQKRISGTVTNYGASYTVASDIIGLALDLDAGEVTFYKNNVSQGAITLPASAGYAIAAGSGSGSKTSVLNFGQDSSFAGNKTAQGNTDANGVGDFYYAPPAGFLALCTANLPDPVIDPAVDDVPADYFNTVLYTGTGSALSVTGVGFQPDWTWIKGRSGATDHALYDAVRGVQEQLESNQTSAETTEATGLTAFGADGFSVGALAQLNTSAATYVAWNWLAGNGTSSNTDGTITSTVSANTTAGFSVVSWTGTGANATVGHGLNSAPDMYIVRNRNDVTNWITYHKDSKASGFDAEDCYVSLNETTGVTDSTVWNNTAPTSSVFSLGTSNQINGSTDNMIAYCFAEVEGYSKFGSYTGNGSADGPFVYCGFRPAFVLIKRTDSTGDWVITDGKRDPENDVFKRLFPNSNLAESTTATDLFDYTSNGFKIRRSDAFCNASGGTYIFMAFAEAPFKYSNAR